MKPAVLINHQERKHKLLSASKAHRWMRCPGSVAYCAGVKDESSAFAKEGQSVAAIVEAHLKGTPFKPTEHADPLINVYIGVVKDAIDSCVLPTVLVEEELDGSWCDPEAGGSCDAIVYCTVSKVAHIIDLKWGVGVLVDVEDNEQLLMYACSLWARLGSPEGWTFHNTIVQPRHPTADPVRTQTLTTDDIHAWTQAFREGAQKVREAIAAFTTFTLVPGDKQCKFCPRRANCDARNRQAILLATDVLGDMDAPSPVIPSTLDDRVLARLLSLEKTLTGWYKSARMEAMTRLKAGNTALGLKIVAGRSTTKWREGMDQAIIDAINAAGGEGARPVTVTEARAYLASDVLESLTYKTDPGVALAPLTDRRPAITWAGDLPDDLDTDD